MLPLQLPDGMDIGSEAVTTTVMTSPTLACVGSMGLSHDKQISMVGAKVSVEHVVVEKIPATSALDKASSYKTTFATNPLKFCPLTVVAAEDVHV